MEKLIEAVAEKKVYQLMSPAKEAIIDDSTVKAKLTRPSDTSVPTTRRSRKRRGRVNDTPANRSAREETETRPQEQREKRQIERVNDTPANRPAKEETETRPQKREETE